MPSLNPTPEQLSVFADSMPADTPILMLNLLRFASAANYPPGSEHSACSGRAPGGVTCGPRSSTCSPSSRSTATR